MKSFKFSKKILLLLLVFSLASGFVFLYTKDSGRQIKASPSDNVSGYAWSENIGWISFNCDQTTVGGTNNCTVSNTYGVSIDELTGDFSGYAWSENIGWIKFDPGPDFDTGLYPGAPQNPANLNLGTREVSGWARACAGTVNGDCNSSTRDDGWDGWIKLRCYGSECDTSNYGVWLDASTTPHEFRDWAWGSDVVGWISFNDLNTGAAVDYQVITSLIINQSPYIESQIIEYQNYCSVFAGQGQIGFKWTYRDDDGDPESQFDFRVNDVNDVNDPNPEVDRSFTGLSNPDGTVNHQTVLVISPLETDKITYNTPYYWWVRVWDDQGNDSGWVLGSSFTTTAHAWPWPDFTHLPEDPGVEEVVYFTDSSTCYDAANNSYPCKEINPITGTNNTYSWNFGDGNFSLDIGNTSHGYPSKGEYTAILSITDDLGTCGGTGDSPVRVGLPLPEWKEVAP